MPAFAGPTTGKLTSNNKNESRMTLFKQLHRYGDHINTHDVFKTVGMLLMFVDHIGMYLSHDNIWLRLIGRGAAPLFFFITGTARSFRFKWNILGYGLLLTLTTYLTKNGFYLNILLNFVLIKLILDHYDPCRSSNWGLFRDFIVLVVFLAVTYSALEYGTFGILFAFAGRLIAQKNPRGVYWLTATILVYFIVQSLSFAFFYQAIYESIFALLCILLWASMFFYHFRDWDWGKFLRLPTLFISRYSLQIYFWHLVILQAVTMAMKKY